VNPLFQLSTLFLILVYRHYRDDIGRENSPEHFRRGQGGRLRSLWVQGKVGVTGDKAPRSSWDLGILDGLGCL